MLLPVQTVSPVEEFDAQEFTTLAVATGVAAPGGSIGTTWTPVSALFHEPFGTYAVTLEPFTRTPRELVGRQEAICGGIAGGLTLKPSVLEPGLPNAALADSHTSYSPPLFGVSENSDNCTGVVPFAGLNVPFE